MGIEPFLISSTLIGVLAQRLVRRLCPDCKQSHTTTVDEQALLSIDQAQQICDSKGCELCQHTGYRGRTGIYELVSINKDIQELIHHQADETQLISALGDQHKSLYQQAIQIVLQGQTSISEMLRVSSEER